jgi:general stress protein 26
MAAPTFSGVDQVMGFPDHVGIRQQSRPAGRHRIRAGSTFGMVGMNGSAAHADIDSGVAVAVMCNRFASGDMTAVTLVDRIVAETFPSEAAMPDREPTAELGAFSSPGAQATAWPAALRCLQEAQVFWLSTVRPDGRPHVTPLIAAWSGNALYFTTGEQERKAHNLRANAQCVMTTGTNALSGLDVTVEGVAGVVTEQAERDAVADAYESKYGDHLTSPDGTWHGLGTAIRSGEVLLYRVDPTVGFAFGKGAAYSQTRYRFPG